MPQSDAPTPAVAAPAPDGGDLLDTTDAGPAAIRGGGLRVAGYAAGVALSVASAALLFRHLGVDDGGRYVTVLALVTMVGGLTDAGLTAIGVREYSTRPAQERWALVRALLGLRCVLTGAGVAVAVAFAALAGFGGVLVVGTILAGIGLLAQALQTTLAVGLMAELRLGLVTALDLVRQVVTVGLIVLLVAAGAALLPFFAVQIAAGLAVLGLTAWLLRGQMPVVPALHPREWANLLRDTVPFAVAVAVASVYFRMAIVIVALVTTEQETGYFGASFRVIEVLVVVPQLLVGAAFPIFARAARDDLDRLSYALGRTLHACLILGVGIALLLGAGAPFVIDVVAGDQFTPAEDVLRVQGLALAASFPAAVLGYALVSLHPYRAVLVVSLVTLVVTAALTAVLAEADGSQGAAVATAAGEVVLALGLWLALRRSATSIDIAPTTFARVAVAGLVALVPMLIGGLPAVPTALLAGAVYLGALVILRAVPQEIVDEITRRRARPA
jgi:O-antigen/teichoic acid export membrane protein